MRDLKLAGAAGLAAGGVVVVGLWMMFERTQRPTLEAKSYVHSIHEAAQGWVRNTDSLTTELRRMPAAVAPLPDLAARYVDGLEGS